MFLFTLQFGGYLFQKIQEIYGGLYSLQVAFTAAVWRWLKQAFHCHAGGSCILFHRIECRFVLCLSIVRNGNVSIVTRTGMLLRCSMKLSHGITTKEFQASNSAFFFSKKRKSLAEKVTLPFQKVGMTMSVLRSVGPRRTNTVSLFPATKISSTARKSGIDSFGGQDFWGLSDVSLLVPVSVQEFKRFERRC